MSDEQCLNCHQPGAKRYDLLVRGNNHSGVYLCEECYQAIQREIAEDA